MCLIVIEGNRKSGKSFFTNSQDKFRVFKFDFNGVYKALDLPEEGIKTHAIGFGKELMIHQLNRDGFIVPAVIMDRGVITNSAWGILNGRTTRSSVYKELDYMVENNLFHYTVFIVITGSSPDLRKKDLWDYMDYRIPEESALIIEFAEYLQKKGICIHLMENKFDVGSLEAFKNIISNL